MFRSIHSAVLNCMQKLKLTWVCTAIGSGHSSRGVSSTMNSRQTLGSMRRLPPHLRIEETDVTKVKSYKVFIPSDWGVKRSHRFEDACWISHCMENANTNLVWQDVLCDTETGPYSDVKMGAITSQITSLTIVYSTVYSGADQRKPQSSAPLAFVIHRWPVNSPHKWPVTRKLFPFDDVIICDLSIDFLHGCCTNTVAIWQPHQWHKS